jgi:hypothetical protein
MGRRVSPRDRPGMARSVVEIAVATLDEVLDGQQESSAVLLAMTPWRRYCRRLVRNVLAEF